MLCDGSYAARTRSDRTNSCFFDLKAEHLILPEEVSFKKINTISSCSLHTGLNNYLHSLCDIKVELGPTASLFQNLSKQSNILVIIYIYFFNFCLLLLTFFLWFHYKAK